MIRRILMRICGYTPSEAVVKDNGIKSIKKSHEEFLRQRGYRHKNGGKVAPKNDRIL